MLLVLLFSEGRRNEPGAMGGMLQSPEVMGLFLLIDLLLAIAVLFSRLLLWAFFPLFLP